MRCISSDNRKEEVMWSRLRMGHTKLNASLHLIGRHVSGLCGFCQESETVEHVLVRCRRPVIRLAREVLKRELGTISGRALSVESLLTNLRPALFTFLFSTRLHVRI